MFFLGLIKKYNFCQLKVPIKMFIRRKVFLKCHCMILAHLSLKTKFISSSKVIGQFQPKGIEDFWNKGPLLFQGEFIMN